MQFLTHRLSTACTLVKNAGTLNVSKKICAATSLFCRGFNGASVNSTGCYATAGQHSTATVDRVQTTQAAAKLLCGIVVRPRPEPTSSLNAFRPSAYTHPHIRSMSSQSVTTPCSIGYFIFNKPRSSWARRPMKRLSCIAPAMTRGCFGRPTLAWRVQRWSSGRPSRDGRIS